MPMRATLNRTHRGETFPRKPPYFVNGRWACCFFMVRDPLPFWIDPFGWKRYRCTDCGQRYPSSGGSDGTLV